MTLWRLRVHVRNDRGRLAGLAAEVAATGGNILGFAVHGCDEQCVVDELVVDFPAKLPGPRVAAAVRGNSESGSGTGSSGGDTVFLTRAPAHALVDETTRALHLAATLRREPAAVPDVLVALLGADAASLVAAGEDPEVLNATDGERDHVLVLPMPAGAGAVVLRRAWAPFTATEVARAQAMLQLTWLPLPAPRPVPAVPEPQGPSADQVSGRAPGPGAW